MEIKIVFLVAEKRLEDCVVRCRTQLHLRLQDQFSGWRRRETCGEDGSADLFKRRVCIVEGEDLQHRIITGAWMDEDHAVARDGAVRDHVAE